MKSGLEYFPLDVHLDEKFELIEAEFGITGFAVVVKLLQRIYGGQGYYCEWTDEVALVFARHCGVGASAVSEIVNASIRRGIFDQKIFQEHGILTSAGIQRRYLDACSRRKIVEIQKSYLLLCHTQIPKNVHICGENVDIFAENVYANEQSKVKESKVKQSKVKESIYSGDAAADDPDTESGRMPFFGEVAELIGDYARALEFYKELSKTRPTDWRAAAMAWKKEHPLPKDRW